MSALASGLSSAPGPERTCSAARASATQRPRSRSSTITPSGVLLSFIGVSPAASVWARATAA